MLRTSKLKDNQQNNDVIQVCFILEGYHQRGPTYPTEDTDRPYPEGFHQRGPTHPTEEDTDRPYSEGFHQRGPKHPTEEDTDRPYSEGFHQMRRPPNHKKSKEETDRHYIREEPAAPDQRLSTDTTAEQNTLIKVIYCKTAYLIRLGLYRIPVYSGFG